MAIQLNPATPGATSPANDVPPKASSTQPLSSLPQAPATDTIKLSLSGSIHQLRGQGQTISNIARALGTDLKSVDALLGIQPAAALSSTPAPPATTPASTVSASAATSSAPSPSTALPPQVPSPQPPQTAATK
ncbi:MAG TPA: hypothetical protein VNW54_03950 [Granulicella sp.]|nr:hypothetical protein [Granulicella sp.]